MFKKVYISTVKNLFRSITFWLALSVFVLVATVTALRGFHGTFDVSINQLIMDTDPRYVLKYDVFIQWMNNSVTSLLLYIVPFFSVIATVIVLTRDYKDDFYEIEKAAGIKPRQYVIARLFALIAVTYLLAVIINLFQVNLYVYTRGGVDGMAFGKYLTESTLRLVRIQVVRIFPCVLFYTCLTYLLGAILKNGILPAAICMAYAIINYIVVLYSVGESGIFLDYLSHTSKKLQNFMHYYDTDKFNEFIILTDTSFTDAVLCIAFLVSCGVVSAIICYMLARKRER